MSKYTSGLACEEMHREVWSAAATAVFTAAEQKQDLFFTINKWSV
jgi:hypothetical protein